MTTLHLINEYLNDVSKVLMVLEQFSYPIKPLVAYSTGVVPKQGVINLLEGEIRFSFHGKGCEVTMGSKVIDFDFDDNECEFDEWKLCIYAKSIGFDNELTLHVDLQNLESQGKIIKGSSLNYFLCR